MSKAAQVLLGDNKRECEHLLLIKEEIIIFGKIMEPDKNEVKCVVCNKRFDLDQDNVSTKNLGKIYNGRIVRWLSKNNFIFAINHVEFELNFSKSDDELVHELREIYKHYNGILLEKREFHTAEDLREAIRKELETDPTMRPIDFLKKYSQRYWGLTYGRVVYNFRKLK